MDMWKLARLQMSDRVPKLTEHVAEWIAEGKKEPQIAQHLAAAGLNLEEARTLYNTVNHDMTERIIEKLEERFSNGITIAIVGALLTIISFFVFRVNMGGVTFVYLITPLVSAWGIFTALQARFKHSQIEKQQRGN